MPDPQDTLLEEFQQIRGAIAESAEAWSAAGQGMGQRDTAPRGNVDSLGDQTGRIDHGSSQASSGNSSSGGIGGIGGALAAGLGIVPLGLEIASLFEGAPSAPPTLTNYAMPDSIGFIGSTASGSALGNTDFGQMGRPRTYGAPAAPAGSPAPASPEASAARNQPIQITVQALDAQSILDRSDDIASAVNKALLALHPITDTISNL